jgi:glycosyltransferase involved in cell wall biosynthesis
MTQRLHTLQIGKSWLPEQGGNGLDQMFFALSRHLPSVGVDVSGMVAGSADAVDRTADRTHAFAPDTAPLYRRLFRARTMGRGLCRRHDFDLIACHFALYGAPLLDTLLRTPTVIHFHGPWAAESAAEQEHALAVRLKALVETCVYRTGTRFVVLSEAFREVLCTQYGVSADRVRIVPGGVDADRFDVPGTARSARERLGWPTDRPIILSVRRLTRRMGLPNLIAALEHVSRKHPDALLYIAGKGPLRDELDEDIRARGLEDHVELLGFVPDEDLPYAYRAADVSVVPTTEHEGFGLITIESLAAGTPVLVTPVGGLPETVRGLSEDLVLPDASTESIQDALVQALDGTLPLPDPDACRQYTRSHFDWPVIARQVRTVYEEVL